MHGGIVELATQADALAQPMTLNGGLHARGVHRIARQAADAVALPVEVCDPRQRLDQQLVPLAWRQRGDAQQARQGVIGRSKRACLNARFDDFDGGGGKPRRHDAAGGEVAGGDHAAHCRQGVVLALLDAEALCFVQSAFIGQRVMNERKHS